GDGSQYRNYVYVEDLAEAHVLALGPSGADEVFNIEGAVPITVRQLVESIGDLVTNEVAVKMTGARMGDYAGRPISAERAKERIGWEPNVPFAEGLGRYVDWYTAAHPPSDPAAAGKEQGPRRRIS